VSAFGTLREIATIVGMKYKIRTRMSPKKLFPPEVAAPKTINHPPMNKDFV
jgi:hypothetical protein